MKKRLPALKSLIATETVLSGNIFFTDGIRLDGTLLGNISADGPTPNMLVVSESGRIEGEIRAAHVVINGIVKGTIYSSELLELQPMARIEGDVHYSTLEMHQGSRVVGRLIPQEPAALLPAPETPPTKEPDPAPSP